MAAAPGDSDAAPGSRVCNEVAAFLIALRLEQYVDVFAANGIDDMETLHSMRPADMQTLGVLLGHQIRIANRLHGGSSSPGRQSPRRPYSPRRECSSHRAAATASASSSSSCSIQSAGPSQQHQIDDLQRRLEHEVSAREELQGRLQAADARAALLEDERKAAEDRATALLQQIPITIHVNNLTGQRIAPIRLLLSDTMHTLKTKIQDTEGIPPDLIRLVFEGKIIANVPNIPTFVRPGIPSTMSKLHPQYFLSYQELNAEQRATVDSARAAYETQMERTASFHNLQNGSRVLLFLNLRGDIGTFVASGDMADQHGVPATLAPGADLLRSPTLSPSSLSTATVAALAHSVLAPAARAPRDDVLIGDVEVVPPAARAALVGIVEAAWARGESSAVDVAYAETRITRAAATEAAGIAAGSTRADFRLVVDASTVQRALGAVGMASMLGALEAVRGVDRKRTAALTLRKVAFALRRTEAQTASPRWIGFHFDQAALTAQVPLGDSAATAGGRTVYALPSGKLLMPERASGRVLAHHGDVAHGVTQLTAGVRYGLYALVARADAGCVQ